MKAGQPVEVVGVDLSDAALQVPVTGQRGGLGGVFGGRHVSPGDGGHSLQQPLARGRGRQVAAEQQHITVRGEGGTQPLQLAAPALEGAAGEGVAAHREVIGAAMAENFKLGDGPRLGGMLLQPSH